MNTYDWYSMLEKPTWAPPAGLFGPVWTVLYILIAVSFGAVLYQTVIKKIPWKVTVPFFLNLAFNVAFTPIQFGFKNNLLAGLDIALVLATLVWAMTKIYPRIKWVALVNIPYLLWVSFATILQFTITYLNW